MRIEGQALTVDYIKQDFKGQESSPSEQALPAAGRNISKENVSGETEKQHLSLDKLKQAVDTVNEAFRLSNYHLEFQIHEKSGKYQIKVVDTDSARVIREIPPEYMLEISASIKQVLDKFLGVFVDALV